MLEHKQLRPPQTRRPKTTLYIRMGQARNLILYAPGPCGYTALIGNPYQGVGGTGAEPFHGVGGTGADPFFHGVGGTGAEPFFHGVGGTGAEPFLHGVGGTGADPFAIITGLEPCVVAAVFSVIAPANTSIASRMTDEIRDIVASEGVNPRGTLYRMSQRSQVETVPRRYTPLRPISFA